VDSIESEREDGDVYMPDMKVYFLCAKLAKNSERRK
jgi:hypothetical protein